MPLQLLLLPPGATRPPQPSAPPHVKRVWDQLVRRGLITHVARGHLSLDSGMARDEYKNKLSSRTMYRFAPKRFCPRELRCAVVAVRGLPPHTGSDVNALAAGYQHSLVSLAVCPSRSEL